METDKLRGRYTDPRLAKTPLAEWMAEYQATRVNLALQTRARDDATVRNHILPSFGSWVIGNIQPIHVAQWVAELDVRRAMRRQRYARHINCWQRRSTLLWNPGSSDARRVEV